MAITIIVRGGKNPPKVEVTIRPPTPVVVKYEKGD